ncbi:MAG: C40 family peptidase [Patescibacteria group bacterium]
MTKKQQERVVSIAGSLVGRPYRYGAKPEEAPNFFDCSSFTQYCFKQVGIEIPRSSILQAADPNGTEIVPLPDYSNLEPGDLLFMRGTRGFYRDNLFPNREVYVGHVVLYLGNTQIIHARFSIGAVGEQALEEFVQDQRFRIVFAKRY